MIKGIGVDVVKVPRIQKILSNRHRHRFLRKVLHQEEINEYQNKKDEQQATFVASRCSI